MSMIQEQFTKQILKPTQSAFGIWSGGHFMHFGQDIGPDRLIRLARQAYELGINTFITADVYEEGKADALLGEALSIYPRDSYFLIGAIGHDFYKGKRQGEKGFPRFTDPSLRNSTEYASYLQMAAVKSLGRLKTNYFDLLMLHNPDSIGYSSEEVWKGMESLKKQKLTRLLGIAPGPANGFTLDIISAFEKFGSLVDWAMIILNPMESWPGGLVLPAAQKYNVKVLARVVDYGGLFWDNLKTGTGLSRSDHRSFRPSGWVEAAQEKLNRFRLIAKEYDMTLSQLAARWTLSQPAVECVVPTLIQEANEEAKPVEEQIQELAKVYECKPLPGDVVNEITKLGDNKNCMSLKGATTQYLGKPQADQWPIISELQEVAKRWNIIPDRDLYYSGDLRDIREIGMAVRGVLQTSQKRLYAQLYVFGNCTNPKEIISLLERSQLEAVLYLDAADPQGIALLFMTENADDLTGKIRELLSKPVFSRLTPKPELTMMGRTYSSGREANLEDWLLHKPRRNALNPSWPWAVWYPLRRKSEFELLSPKEQGKILLEHAMIGRAYGDAGYAADIRLACYGLDQKDNEFVLGIVGPELYPLSRLVQEMRKTQQTAKYMQSLGPFFVGKVCWQSPLQLPK